MVLGGQAVPLGLGMSGCSYSVKGKAMRLTLTLSDDPSAARNYTTLRKNAKGSAWLVADEQTLGLLAFSEFVKKPGQPVKVGFIVAKGTKLIQFYLTDSTGAAKRETVDKLRPIAKRVIDRI